MGPRNDEEYAAARSQQNKSNYKAQDDPEPEEARLLVPDVSRACHLKTTFGNGEDY